MCPEGRAWQLRESYSRDDLPYHSGPPNSNPSSAMLAQYHFHQLWWLLPTPAFMVFFHTAHQAIHHINFFCGQGALQNHSFVMQCCPLFMTEIFGLQIPAIAASSWKTIHLPLLSGTKVGRNRRCGNGITQDVFIFEKKKKRKRSSKCSLCLPTSTNSTRLLGLLSVPLW